MAILFVQSWDLIRGKEEEYARFISETYIPNTTSMGLVSVGGYYVEVGVGPRIIAVTSAEELDDLMAIVTERRFKKLTVDLKSHLCNYRSYVLEPTGRVKSEKYTIQKGVWKFNQYYDVRPGCKEGYSAFILNEYLSIIRQINYVEVTGGWNVLFGGVSEIIAELTFRDPVDIGRLLGNEDFRRITLELKNEYVTNYDSRILRCTERFDDHKWFKL